jgi:predicted DCC family thiol-disulfide oxidoreductase YuxK
MASPPRQDLILYDGVCGLCNGFNTFVIARDAEAIFLFASLQSPLGRGLLARHGRDAGSLDTLGVVAGYPDGPLLVRSDGVLHVLRRLPAPWGLLARLGSLVPRPLRNLAYRAVASQRYRIFGRHEACPLPAPGVGKRFLDV